MRGFTEKAIPTLRLGLFTLLLAAQCLSLAHAVDHAGLGDNPVCAACSISNGLDAAVHAAPLPPSPRSCLPPIEATWISAWPRTRSAPHPVRAPPALP